jgi:hypothetical protein
MAQVSDCLSSNKTMLKKHMLTAGKILKKEGEGACRAFCEEHAINKDEKPTFPGGPVSCSIIAVSRPIEEWDISKSNTAIQTVIFSLPKDKLPKAANLTAKVEHERWLKENGLSDLPFRDVQGLNKIIGSAISTYEGVQVKVDNKNKKLREKNDRKNEGAKENGGVKIAYGDEIKAFDDNGFLIQKPSPNSSIYCYNQVSPKPFIVSKYPKINLPKNYTGYYRQADEPIRSPYPIDRLSIAEGQPGYVPEHHRSLLSKNKHKRMRLPKSLKKDNAILAIISISDDWCIFDLRGLLRVNHWREKFQPDHTIQDLLNHFTGDPVIDFKRNVVRFRYKEEYGIVNREPVREKKGKNLISSLVEKKGAIKLAAIDVGQINPIAVGIFDITLVDGVLSKKLIETFAAPDCYLEKIKAYRERCDALEESLKEEAITLLSSEQQEEYRRTHNIDPKEVANDICRKFGFDPQDLSWNEMSSNTHFISNLLSERGNDRSTFIFLTNDDKEVIKYDRRWASENKPKLSAETRKAHNDKLWDRKINSNEYKKLSVSKQQVAREIANFVATKADVIVIENLVKSNNFFSGSGKRNIGWNNFFQNKRENRWWINAIHKALGELAQNKGKPVILASFSRTSMTCPKCKYCDKQNRNAKNREMFKCIQCGIELNADTQVATANLATVAITGVPMPKPAREQQGDAKTPGTARSGENGSDPAELAETRHERRGRVKREKAAQKEVARKAADNAA